METTFEDTIKQFSGFTQAKLAITAPLGLDTDMEFKRLTLICGMNDTGKSFLTKLNWATATFFNMKIVEKVTGISDPDKSDEEVFQFILDNTFSDNNITGAADFNSRDEILKVAYYNIRFEMKDGKLTWLKFSFPEDAQPMGAITYLSKEAREFANIERYLKTKKMLGIDAPSSWKDLEALTEWYKLYDVFAIEGLIPKFEKANIMLDMVRKMGSGDMISEIGVEKVEFDKEAGKLWYYKPNDERKTKRAISSLGAGSQSMLLMIMSAVQA